MPEDQVRNPDPAELQVVTVGKYCIRIMQLDNQVALASKIGLYEELCPLIKSDGYDAFCTHAAWQKMVGCEYGVRRIKTLLYVLHKILTYSLIIIYQNPAAASFAPCTGSRYGSLIS